MLTREKYQALVQDEESSPRDGDSRTKLARKYALTAVLGFCLLVSVALNVDLLHQTLSGEKGRQNLSNWAHLTRNVTTPIYASTQYGPSISTPEELDRLWGELDVSPGLIRISDKWADANGLPRSTRFPWDNTQGMYYLGAFHQMHCLKEIYTLISSQGKGIPSKTSYEHLLHCMDTLLQDVMCHADDTPWYQLPPQPYRENYAKFQTRQCKDWQALLRWAEERGACFQYDVLDADGKPVEDIFEHYRFCPEGSPYIPAMESYFERKVAKAVNGSS
ncbi:uncharacterized protein BP5553_09464 [Venustampulla echinocandica]|uniref:Uncharacterized protein n=1 Tax=Venustampulla echinocandica TaxID=2656787 RepID=A0A370TCT2_9HELO|nr:uncharacterized protein BP5553_09464 [Venustampulla echinocandica]RDL32062.1 hypothetical protein BP5553_09464 [Venustampulla echinocandica]